MSCPANTYQSRFQPGDPVIIGDDIPGTVERVIFARGRATALIAVEWWCDGAVRWREFHEDEVRLTQGPQYE